jgi:arsenate reductase
MTPITILHNPACGTSRNTLALIRQRGIEPEVIEYLKHPLNREQLLRLGIPPRELLRSKEALATELGLNDPAITDEQLIDAMAQHPVLMNRPVVITPLGTRLCRPAEQVVDLLPPL